MDRPIDVEISRVVGAVLGVAADEILAGASLVDDLAVDSLDLLELGVELEAALGVALTEPELRAVRTYDDLRIVVYEASRRAHRRITREPLFVHTQVRSGGGGASMLTRAGWLTPYLLETLADDCRRAGPGAQLDVRVAASLDDEALPEVYDRLELLTARGVRVAVTRAETPRARDRDDGWRVVSG